jgi:shikimate dehydrogenase
VTTGLHLAIIGWPLGHTASPRLWEGMGKRRGIPVVYESRPVAPDDVVGWTALWGAPLSGFNVTSPYKERAARACARLAPTAERIGAANLVRATPEGWEGHSTDGYGFARALLAEGESMRGRTAAVLGSGGAGRAVACALADAGARVTLVTRAPDREPRGCAEAPRIAWDDVSDPFDIVVNATTIGAEPPAPPIPYERCCAGALAVDLHYVPPVTAFLTAARDAGARILNGFGMLVHQACMGAALLVDGDAAAAESYEEDFWAAAREMGGDA